MPPNSEMNEQESLHAAQPEDPLETRKAFHHGTEWSPERKVEQSSQSQVQAERLGRLHLFWILIN